jgi:septal ring factor EnvC (AmiA/AmiB activator)
MKYSLLQTILLAIVLIPTASPAQKNTDIQTIQRELKKLETELQSKTVREKTLLTQVEDLEHEIGLRRKLMNALETERQKKERTIAEKESLLESLNRTRDRLEAIIRKRIIRMYKRSRLGEWEALLVMKSLNQMMVWLKYNKRILDNDQRNLNRLMETKQDILNETDALQKELKEKERLIHEKTNEADKLETQKSSQKELLSRVRKDQQSLQEQIRLKKNAFQTIRGEIGRREKEALPGVSEVAKRFAALKGKMEWPVKGRIVSKHGTQEAAGSETGWPDPGIEIEAADREPVRAVFSGTVSTIVWLQGMGNIVMLQHGGGYYTVYAHLEVVLVFSGQEVLSREIIGHVGDKYGLYKSNLHFQIWNKRMDENPETWLRK